MLQQALEEEREASQSLHRENQLLTEQLKQKEESSDRKLLELSRENEVLKTQLKKYVAAVQMLRKDKIITDEAKEGKLIVGYSLFTLNF